MVRILVNYPGYKSAGSTIKAIKDVILFFNFI